MTDLDIDKQTARFAALLAEQFDEQLTKILETMDSRIEHHVAPLQMSMDTMQADIKTIKIALTDTNTEIKTLREDLTADIRLLKRNTRALKTSHDHLDSRVGQLEKTAA